MVVFLPSLWIFAQYTSAELGAVLGLVFIAGRALYALTYVADPKKRTAGFVVGYLANVALVGFCLALLGLVAGTGIWQMNKIGVEIEGIAERDLPLTKDAALTRQYPCPAGSRSAP